MNIAESYSIHLKERQSKLDENLQNAFKPQLKSARLIPIFVLSVSQEIYIIKVLHEPPARPQTSAFHPGSSLRGLASIYPSKVNDAPTL